MTTPGVLRAVAAAALVLAVAGCGGRESGVTATEPEVTREGPVTLVDGEVLLSCGGRPGWPASAMVDGIEPSASAREIAAGLSAAPVPGQLRTNWKVLAEDGDQMVVALGDWSDDGPARDAMAWTLERDGGTWRGTSGGNCWMLAPVLDEDATWVQVDASEAVDGAATEIAVDVHERACASARDPEPFLDEPVMVSTEESVIVYWTSRAPGAANCPSNPTSQQVLTLDEPLGDRPLLDGSRWPPALVGQAESASDQVRPARGRRTPRR